MQFAQDAGLFSQQLDIPNDRVLLVAMTQADYESASFLDNRLLQPAGGQTQGVPAQQQRQLLVQRNRRGAESNSKAVPIPGRSVASSLNAGLILAMAMFACNPSVAS